MLAEPAPTPYDLRFQLFGTPVRVSPWFWVVMTIFGWDLINIDFIYVVAWVVCGFLSILLHEFGHVWAGKAFGSDGYIVLYGLGGLAVGASSVAGRWRRVVVYLAGPLIQLAGIWLPLWLWKHNLGDEGWLDLPIQVKVTAIILMEINLYWPLLNLIPVWPLDGGQVSREVCTGLAPGGGGVRASLIISAATAGLLAVNALVAASNHGVGFLPHVPTGGMFMVLFFGILAVESFQALNQVPPWQRYDPDDSVPWEREREPWER